MQAQFFSQAMLEKKRLHDQSKADEDSSARSAPLGFALSFRSQLQLRAIRDSMDRCLEVLHSVREDSESLEKDPENTAILVTTAKQLGQICLEADSWGYYFLYHVAFALQKALLESGASKGSRHFWEIFQKGLAILSTLVKKCEMEFRAQMAVDDILEDLAQIAEDRMTSRSSSGS